MALNQAVVEKLEIAEVDLAGQLAGDVSEIFSTMVGVEEINYLSQEVEAVTHLKNSVTAMVGLAGTCNGMVCLHTSRALALCFTAQMLGMDVSEVEDDVNDALGEIANMIGGSFKHHLSNNGNDIKLSTPSVVTGTDYSFSTGRPGDTLTLLFSAKGEEFLVSVVLETD
jgi:chemotaxis protein CheX